MVASFGVRVLTQYASICQQKNLQRTGPVSLRLMSSSDCSHAQTVVPERAAALLAGLQAALWADAPELASANLRLLQDTGLAHDHVQLVGKGVLARIPKQSQMRLDACANLQYERTCFERTEPSGHTPHLRAVLPVSRSLARGALLVEQVLGAPAQLPQHLGAVMQALASIHALPLPEVSRRAPLLNASDPLVDLLGEIQDQAAYLAQAALSAQVLRRIQSQLTALQAACREPSRPERSLIAFDAHPGNFLLLASGDAVLVDLEKCRYSYPGLDLAHATLYTSTTWDIHSQARLNDVQLEQAYGQWERSMGEAGAERARPWHAVLRRSMWLWSITWCAQWQVLSRREAQTDTQGQDWSADLSNQALVAHVAQRVAHYLDAQVVDAVCDGLDRFDLAMRT